MLWAEETAASLAEAGGGTYPTTALGALIVALLLVLSGLVWLLRHLFSITLPGMNVTFSKALEMVGAANDRAREAQATASDKSLERVLDHHERQNALRDERFASETAALLRALQDQGEILEGQGKSLESLGKTLAVIATSLEGRRRDRHPQHPPTGGQQP